MERKAFVISRATWWRGHTAVWSSLLIQKRGENQPPESEGKMCCLGSIALQCGATADEIGGVDTPAALAHKSPALDLLVVKEDGPRGFSNSEVAQQMMECNDHPDVSDATRESQLTSLAATIGWDITFTD